jgi:hypothetical protein
MNKAVFVFTGLAQWSRISKIDMIAVALFFFGMVCAIHVEGNTKSVETFLDFAGSPLLLLILGYSFGRNVLSAGARTDEEYLALLFTRPITRASYLLTKVAVVAIGIQLLLLLLAGLAILAQFANGYVKPVMPNPWLLLTWLTNSVSIACLSLLLNALPPRPSYYAFLLCIGISANGLMSLPGIKLPENYTTLSVVWEGIWNIGLQLFNPLLDLQSSIVTTTFSMTPFVTYLSNCLLYLWLAIAVLNKREFSYAQN